jgi:hypothetical protein
MKGSTEQEIEQKLAEGFEQGRYRPPSRPGIVSSSVESLPSRARFRLVDRLLPERQYAAPHRPACDGCHSVNYNIHAKAVTEWNVGCEKCHGPEPEHAAKPSRENIVNPARLDFVQANNVCIQCHSQGQPLKNPIEGKYYDWPVGFEVGKNLQDFWKLEEHKLGEQSFTHFADGTAHKNQDAGQRFRY